MTDSKQLRANWQDEIDSAAIYRALAAQRSASGSLPRSTAVSPKSRRNTRPSGKTSCAPPDKPSRRASRPGAPARWRGWRSASARRSSCPP